MHTESKKELFEQMPVPQAIRIMAVPAIMGQLIVLIYNMADTYFLGQTNDPDMVAAASLILPVFNIALSLSGLTGVGGGALISRLLGSHYEAFAGGILRFFIQDPETVRLGISFLRIRCLATPLMFLSFFHVFLFNGFGRGDKALFLGIARWAVFNIPMLFLLNRMIGMYGLVWSQVTADVFTVVLSLIVYARFEKTMSSVFSSVRDSERKTEVPE